MSFIRFWIGFSLIGVAAAVALLGWSLRRRQFAEPDRAAMLPLAGMPSVRAPVRRSREASALAAILGAGLAALAASVALSLAW